MESERHLVQSVHLRQAVMAAPKGGRRFYAACDMAFYFSETQARNQDFRAPDFFIVLDVDGHERKSWVTWEEGGRLPDVIAEIVSESTEHKDRGEKKSTYEWLRIPWYFIFDPFTGQLDGCELDQESLKYRPIEPDTHGRLQCRPLGLSLGVVTCVLEGIEAPWLRWFDAAGRMLLAPSELAAQETERADAEAERADAEAERADALARRVAELEARLKTQE